MDISEFKSNSHKSKEEANQNEVPEKRVEKVVTGTVKTKENNLRKFTDVFISEDVKNVKSYIFLDVLVPTIKKAIVDIVTDGVNMIFFGGTGSRKGRNPGDYVSYRNYSDRGDRHNDSPKIRTRLSYEDIILETRGEAERVLDQMQEVIETYGMVSVADLYDSVGLTGDYTDNKYGWTNIRNAEAIRVRDGYALRLPKALPLK